MEEEKKFPTPAMLKAREKWAQKPEEEKEAFRKAFEEDLKTHFEGRFSQETRKALLGEETNE